MSPLTVVAWTAGAIYATAVVLLALYGLHSLWLLALFLRHRTAARATEERERAATLPTELPAVLVQLPVFNERDVVNRLVDAVGRLDWPADRLHIQVLDDSTDDSVEIGRQACARLQAKGLQAESIHRIDRRGFKAGALQNGMARCAAPFIAIFDADFTPDPDFLKKAIGPLLADPGLALVQGRWEHLNRHESMLTSAQSLGIDGHFAVEQGARAWSGLAMNFNGTCGLWRRQAIEDAGGWEHDTLTEDMDLSYRAQLKGWRCTYRLGLAVPGEVPASVSAWRAQQFRWAKGSVQTAIKLLPRVWRSAWGLEAKLGASLHMTHYFVHPLILVSLFSAPFALLLIGHTPAWVLMCGLACFLVGASAPIITYVTSQLVLYGRSGLRNLRHLPVLAALGTGIAVSNSQAVVQALMGRQSPFVRTPKGGSTAVGKATSSYRARTVSGMAELFCAGWAAGAIGLGLTTLHTWVTPLLALYLSGFLWMAILLMRERFAGAAGQTWPSPLPWLVPAGLAFTALAWFTGRLAPWNNPGVESLGAVLGLGALFLVAVVAVRHRPGGRATLVWIALVALTARLALLPAIPGPEAHRAVVEARQAAAGLDPYRVAPADAASTEVNARLPQAWRAQLASPEETSATAPVTAAYQRLCCALRSNPRILQFGGLVLDLAAVGLVLAMLVRTTRPATALLLAAWNPASLLLFTGAGSPLAAAALLLALGLYLASGSHLRRATTVLSLAGLAAPITAPALLASLWGARWQRWLVPLALAGVCLLGLGSGLLAWPGTLLRGEGGVLAPLLTSLLAPALPLHLLTPTVGVLLVVALITGLTLATQRLRRGWEAADHPELAVVPLAVTLACLPGLGSWDLWPLALLAPFVRSTGLLLWPLVAPLALLIPDPAWAALVVHLPPLGLAIAEGLTGFDPVRLRRRAEVEDAIAGTT